MKTMMTVAGSDASGGAGIQADIKTATALGVYATSAITAITAQNTMGIRRIDVLPSEAVEAQMRAILEDIPPDAVKIGMLSSAETIRTVARCLRDYAGPVVVDPVLVASSGARLLEKEALTALTDCLFPVCDLITPNLPEAAVLLEQERIEDGDIAQIAASLAKRYSLAVLVKGGHAEGDATDVLYDGAIHYFTKPRVEGADPHGTGCTLSSAIACYLSLGAPLPVAVEKAKEYVYNAIESAPNLGSGKAPLNHMNIGGK